MHTSKVFLTFFLFLSFLSSCTLDDMEDNAHPSSAYDGDGLLFRLKAERFNGVNPATRAADLTVPFDTICAYILSQESEEIVADCEVKIDNSVGIVAKGLRTGKYNLLILAVKGNYKEDGATIHKITDSSSPWLSFDESIPAKPLKTKYYYTKHAFSVVDGYTKEEAVRIPQAMGLASFDLQYMSDYVRKSVDSCRFVPSVDSKCYSALLGNGSYSGSRNIEAFSLSEQTQFLLFPTADSSLSGKVVVNTTNHRKESFEMKYDIQATINAAKRSPIEVHTVHPDDNVGINIADELTPENYHTILSDDEPASVYTKRTFYIAKPLQVSMKNDSLHLTFYSPVGIKDATIMAKSPAMNEFVEFCFLDSIPAFADIRTSVQVLKEGLYRTESGRIQLFSAEDMNPDMLEFKVSSPDPYWAKISQIKAKWRMGFSLYGGDPITGANNGSWRAVRPVHCREAIALYLNIGYMCTMDEFHKFVMTLKLYDNNGNSIDPKIVIPKLEGLGGFDVGLVYSAHSGTAGLGGGRTWGVLQEAFTHHYNNASRCTTIFHEIGHCMGYNHNSNMTYPYSGNGWANNGANNFYVQNISSFPVSSYTILNSRANPNLY